MHASSFSSIWCRLACGHWARQLRVAGVALVCSACSDHELTCGEGTVQQGDECIGAETHSGVDARAGAGGADGSSGSGDGSGGRLQAEAGGGAGGHAAGGAGASGKTGQSLCPVPDGPVLSDLEPGEIAPWDVVPDASATHELAGTAVTTGPVAVSGGAPDSEYAFYLEGSGFEDWGALARLRGCWDVSGFKGIRFWAKGSVTNMVFEATMGTTDTHPNNDGGTCESECYNDYIAGGQPVLTDVWGRYEMEFSDLANRHPGGKIDPFNYQLVSVNFRAIRHTDTQGTSAFEMWIDDVKLF